MTNAAAIKTAAADLLAHNIRVNQFDRKVWISDVVDALLAQNPGWTREQVKAAIWAARNEVVIGSADLVAAYDPAKLRDSTLSRAANQHWCFVWVM